MILNCPCTNSIIQCASQCTDVLVDHSQIRNFHYFYHNYANDSLYIIIFIKLISISILLSFTDIISVFMAPVYNYITLLYIIINDI